MRRMLLYSRRAYTIDEEVHGLVVVIEVLHEAMDSLECLHRLYAALSAFEQTRGIPYLKAGIGAVECNPIARSVLCEAIRFARYDGQRLSGVTQHLDQRAFSYTCLSKGDDIIDLVRHPDFGVKRA
jgi:hypothetical protein